MTPRLGPGSVVAVWSADALARRLLAEALAQRFVQRGRPAVVMPDASAAAAVKPADLRPAAHALRQHIDDARRQALVVVDGSPLSTLAAGGLAPDDWPQPLVDAERAHAFTLLIAPADATPAAAARDTALRRAFAAAALPCAVIHGRDGTQRLARAWMALQSGLDGQEDAPPPARRLRPPTWNCERCSDPECEHRLFTDLIAGRPRAGG
ncbi:hypothetical protein [Pseudacidovorax intermedius]|uniref:Uncharacterized protein n=1 Tax=Pseudacidovorax intermedius TaxID=433924 RepID=A0A147GMQ8_9BURK|nr:hypothetical protein [Pseudacidovorax intermedius]KTT14811.1 hypothetical protein NS331_22290 [Pseudacidovorax intermedius]